MISYTKPKIEIIFDLYQDVIMASTSQYGKEMIGEDPYSEGF